MKIRTSLLLFSILATWVLSIAGEKLTDMRPCNFPAIYNFGDSNSDTGGISAAFYPTISPCGETFFHRPVGRGCDGRLMIDLIANHLGLPYLSAYLDSIGANFRHGANFATGGATIRRQNESVFLNGVSPFPIDIQVVQFTQFRKRTSWLYKQAKKRSERRNLPRPQDFSKALYTFDIGQNDLAVGFRTMSNKRFKKEIRDIINQFAKAVRDLYKQGARTFWIHNTGPIGCLAVTLRDPDHWKPGYYGCVESQNDMAKEFNRRLKRKVSKLREKLPLAAITYVDLYTAKYKLINNAKKEGFLDKAKICCGYHEDKVHVWCGNKAKINGTKIYAGSCEDPSLYISWDGVHYTEAANHWVVNHFINGSLSYPHVPITRACHRL
ncbi:hypothetical protein TIFTF001_011830 [Ficus carica]|uniref:GDSL esterase/lipase At5g14450-like n=1 Tax=Ficus carica TaxID=3494 RepID=A0AA88AMG5_FICCA|nr:hypothetical protein TIFTF001_011830 [Ficus carica]